MGLSRKKTEADKESATVSDPYGIAPLPSSPPKKAEVQQVIDAPASEAGSFYPKAGKTPANQVLDPFIPPPAAPTTSPSTVNDDGTDTISLATDNLSIVQRRRRLSLWALFSCIFLSTVAISLAVNWYVFGPEAPQILPEIREDSTTEPRPIIDANRMARTQAAALHQQIKAAQNMAKKQNLAAPCPTTQNWARPEMLLEKLSLTLTDKSVINGTFIGTIGCNVLLKPQDTGLQSIPMENIQSSQQI